jgi:hypothetical protein
MKSYTRELVKLIVTAALVALAYVLGLPGWLAWRIAPVAAATPATLGTKFVYIDAQYRVDPITITKVTVGDQQIQPGMSTAARVDQPAMPFQADEDWLKNMSISLLNRTDKVIVRVEIMLFFPDTGNGVTPPGSISPAVMVYTMTLGHLPEIDSYSSHGQKLPPEPDKHPILLAPGGTLVIHVGDYIDAMRSRVEETLPFSQVTRVAIRRLRVYFVDGMQWSDLYGFGTPDPNRPGQFAHMDRNRFFPGDPRNNWPPPTQQVAPGRRRSE